MRTALSLLTASALTPALAIALSLTLPATAAPPQGGGSAAAPGDRSGNAANDDRRDQAARQYFTDVELVDQQGRTHRLFSDLLDDKVVVIDTIFTTCTGVCPVLSKTMSKIQDRAGERLGEDVYLLSITVDPKNDTPEAMREYAEKWDAREGWYFLSGDPKNVQFALERLGQWVDEPETHKGLFLMGNQRTGLWKKAFGLAPAQEILAIFDSVAEDQGASGGS